jgi:hypothetical protein
VFKAHKTLAMPATVALCLCVAACGSTSQGVGSASRSASGAATEAAGGGPASSNITGDYDGDDDYSNQRSNDGDNDDSTKPKDRDNDSDSSGKSYFDSDDSSVRGFGHAADSAEGRTIASLVRRYFAAANAGDGATACSIMVPGIARSVPEDIGGPAGPLYARGTTCAVVMSKAFVHYHRQIAAHAATLRIAAVRVKRGNGVAVLAFNRLPGREIHVAREGDVWKIQATLDAELP